MVRKLDHGMMPPMPMSLEDAFTIRSEHKGKKIVRCLECGKILRLGDPDETPSSNPKGSQWFCSRAHMVRFAQKHGQLVVKSQEPKFEQIVRKIQMEAWK